jgi:hypothetical protein
MMIFAVVLALVIGLGIGMVLDEVNDKHKWGDWETIDDHEITTEDGQFLGRVTVQKRTCAKTGEIEHNTLQAAVQEVHDWEEWKMNNEGNITRGKNNITVGSFKLMERKCKRTGKVEWDKMEWTLGELSS